MKRLRCVVLLPLLTAWAIGQPVTNQPEAVVRSLYHEVVVRHPVGIPHGADWKIFAPYLSEPLLHRIDLAHDCARDWNRQNQGRILKAPFGWGEAGLFSGGDEKASPGDFQIERAQAEKDGSFRVDVKLTFRPSDGPGSWRVEAVVVRENGRLVVDDVLYLKDKGGDVESRLSEVLSAGCSGPRWVGYGNRPR
jgi:hypothetical protein